jgi:hypothetical protein
MPGPMRSGSNFGGLADSGTSVHARWRGGVFLPALVAAWGIYTLFAGEFGHARSGRAITGPAARAIGLLVLSCALFWHVQQFWESEKGLARHAFAAKVVISLVFLAALGWFGYAAAPGWSGYLTTPIVQ